MYIGYLIKQKEHEEVKIIKSLLEKIRSSREARFIFQLTEILGIDIIYNCYKRR